MAKQKTEKTGVTTQSGPAEYTFTTKPAQKTGAQIRANTTTANGSLYYEPVSREALAQDRVRRTDWRLNGTAERWTRDLDSIISYAQDESKGSREKTQSWYEQARKNLEEIRSTLAGSENLDASSGTYLRKRAQNYEDVLDYLQDRTWYENSRDREQAQAELQAAQDTLQELQTRYNAANSGGNWVFSRFGREEMEAATKALSEQQSVVAQLQEKVQSFGVNTSEEREQKIRDYQEAQRAYLDAAAYATTEAELAALQPLRNTVDTLGQELRDLDTRMYNGQMDYTAEDRTKDVLSSTAKGIGGSVANAAGTMLDALNESGRERLRNPDIGILGERTGPNAPVQGMEETYARRAEQAEERNLMDEGAERLQAMADRLGESAALELERAKNGLSELGQFGIDMAANALQMGFDIAVGAATGTGALVPMFARTFGDAAREARLAGADINKQLAYGVTKGAIEVATEKIFDGLAGAFGKGVADDVTEAVIRRLSRTDVGRTFLRGIAGAANEGVEEVLSDVFGTFADKIYRDESLRELWQENMETALYDFLLGAAMGSVGSAVTLVNGENAAKNAELRLQDMADERLTGLDVELGKDAPQHLRLGQDLRKEGVDPKDYTNALRKDAEGFVGPRTEKETAAQTAAEKVQARYQAEALAQLRKQTDIHGQASTQKMEVRYRDTTVQFTGFSVQDGKTMADLRIGTAETTVPLSEVTFGSDATGQFLQELSRQDPASANTMLGMYAGQDIGRYIDAWNTVEKVYGRYATNATAEMAAQNKAISSVLTPEQIQAAWLLGRETQKDAVARASVPEGTPAAQLKPGTGKVSYDGAVIGGVRYGAVDLKTLNEKQQKQISAIEALAEATGINFVFYQTTRNEAGRYTGQNGAYGDGVIYLDVNAGLDRTTSDGRTLGEIAIIRTAAHELTHFIQDFNARDYETVRGFLVDVILEQTGAESLEALIEQKKALNTERELTDEEALDEVIADGCEMMLKNTHVVEMLAQEQPTIANRIRRFLRDWCKKITAAFEGVEAFHTEAKLMTDRAQEMQQIWDNALAQAARNRSEAEGVNSQESLVNSEANEKAASERADGRMQYSSDRYGNVIVDQDVNMTTVRSVMQDIFDGKYKGQHRTIPILKHTPQVFLDYCHLSGDRSFVMWSGKAYQDMQNKNEKQHALGVDGMMEIIRQLYTPEYIVLQNFGENAGHYAAVVTINDGESLAIVDLGSERWGLGAIDGESGFYNVLVTAFEPDADYLENNIFDERNDIVYDRNVDKKYEAPELGNFSETHSEPSEGTSSGTTVSQDGEESKDNLQHSEREHAGEGQMTFDDITYGAYSGKTHASIRDRLEKGDELRRQMKEYFRNVDPENSWHLTDEQIDDLLEVNPYGNFVNGDMNAPDDVMISLSHLAENKTGAEKTEIYQLMEALVEHMPNRTAADWTENIRYESRDPAFTAWYEQRHPNIYYPGYYEKGHRWNWNTLFEEKRYLETMLEQNKFPESDRARAEDMLQAVDEQLKGIGSGLLYSEREHQVDERELMRDWAARPETKDPLVLRWHKRVLESERLQQELRSLQEQRASLEQEDTPFQNIQLDDGVTVKSEGLQKIDERIAKVQEKLEKAQRAIERIEKNGGYKAAVQEARKAWAETDPKEAAKLIRELRETNRQLQEYADYWKDQAKLTDEGEQKAKRSDVQRFAKELIDSSGYKGSAAELTARLQELGDMVVSNNAGQGLSWSEVNGMAQAIAEEIVANSYLTTNTNAETREALRTRLRELRIAPDQTWTGDIPDFDSFRKHNFGTLFFSKEGMGIDDVYQILNGEFGDYWFPSEVTAGSDQIYQILTALDRMRPQTSYAFQDPGSAAMAVQFIQNDITQTMLFGNIGQELSRADLGMRQLAERLRQAETEAKENRKSLADLQKMQQFEIRDALKKQRDRMNERKEIEKHRKNIGQTGRRLLKYLTENSTKNPVPEPFKKAVGSLLMDLDLSRGLEKRAQERYQRDMQDVIRIVAQQTAFLNGESESWEGMYIDLPPGIMEELQAHLDNVRLQADALEATGETWNPYLMNREELETLDEVLTAVATSIRNANEILAAGKGQQVSTLAEEGIRDLEKLGPDKYRTGTQDKLHKFLRWQNTTPYYFFKKFGASGEAIFRNLQNGWDKFAFNAKQVIDYAEQAYTAAEAKEARETVYTFQLEKRRTDLNEDVTTENVTMTKAQVMSLYALWKREQAQGHIAGSGIRIADYTDAKTGRTVTQAENYLLDLEDVAKITGVLTARDKEIVDALQKHMNTVGSDWGNEVSLKRFGIRSFTEENYWPITTDPRTRTLRNPESDQANLFRLLNSSFTKKTVRDASNPLVVSDCFDTYANHMADMAKYNGLGLAMLDAMKWMSYSTNRNARGEATDGYRSMQKAVEAAYGREALNYFTTFMKDLNGVREGGRGEDLGSRVLSSYKVAAVGANIRVALLQPTSYLRAGLVLDAKYLRAGLRMNNRQGREEAMQHSGTAVWKDMGFYDTNINAGLREMIKHTDTWKDRVQEASMKGAEMGDKVTWGALWNACKAEQQERTGLDGEALLEATAARFREVVYASQVMDSTMTRSHMMRQKGVYAGMVTAFMSEPTLTFNMVMDAYSSYESELRQGANKADAWQRAKPLIKKTTVAYLSTAILAALAESLIDAARDDEKYATYAERFLKAFPSNFAEDVLLHNKVPILKDFVSIMGGGSTSRMDQEWMLSLYKAGAIWKETVALQLGLQEEATKTTYYGNMTDWGKIYNTLKAASQLTGLPMANLTRDVLAIWNTTVGGFAPGMKVSTYDPGEEKSIQYAVQDGYLTEDEAVEWLLKYELAADEEEARQMAFVWGQENGKYTRVMEALGSGDPAEFTAAVDEMIEYGFDPKTIYQAVKNEVKDLYLTGDDNGVRISKEKTLQMLQQYAGMNGEAAKATTERWTCEVVTGIAYDDLKDAYLDGRITAQQAQNMRVQYGGAKEEDAKELVAKWTCEKETGYEYNDLSLAYAAGEFTRGQMRTMLQRYGGKTPDEAESTLTRWDFIGSDSSMKDVTEAMVTTWNGSLKSAGFTKQEWYRIWTDTKSMTADKDANGETINGSKRTKILNYINGLAISKEKKDTLYLDAFNYSQKTIHTAPWH